MSQENKEFYDLLNELVNEQTFDLELTDGTITKTKQLTTAQLKELIKTVVDSPITQSQFNSTATKIFVESLNQPKDKLTIVDRLLFLLAIRANSLSPTKEIEQEHKKITVNFNQISKKLIEKIKQHKEKFASKEFSLDKITLGVSVPLLTTESQLNEELYKNQTINVEDTEQLRKVLGEAFINEIAKTVEFLTINEKTLDLSTVTFKSRLKTIESLPAQLIQKVIEYIEDYKKIVDECLTVDGYTVPIDGSLFSVR